MQNINKFIGIPYDYENHGFDGCNCINLCGMFYKDNGWPEIFDDGLPVNPDEHGTAKTWRRIYRYLNTYFNPVEYDDLQYGDFVLFKILGDIHCGIYVGYGKLLAHQVPCVVGKTETTLYNRQWWSRVFHGAYRRKGSD